MLVLPRAFLFFCECMLIDILSQVEKVIERIFPSQSPEAAARRLTNEKSPEQLAQDEADAEAKKDTMYIMLTIFGVLLFVTITMVRLAIHATLDS